MSNPTSEPSVDNLLRDFAAGKRRALARLLTLAEIDAAPPIPADTQSRRAKIVGITGSAGAGKSTLVGALVKKLRAEGRRVAVLANDPQSPVTGGALLGDRIRVPMDPADDGVFFRSISTRGAAGGISAGARRCLDWLEAFGFDIVLVETVGVGQDQWVVRNVVDVLVLLVTPGTGDEVQWEKAGLIEVVDLIVVHKADMPGADRVKQQLTHALSLAAGARQVPILMASAGANQGIGELLTAIDKLPAARQAGNS